MRKKILGWLLGGLLTFTAGCGEAAVAPEAANPVNPKTEMIQLAGELGQYAKAKRPGFQLVGNGAAGLLEVTPDNPKENVDKLVQALDGFLTESVFYTESDQGPQPQEKSMLEFLKGVFALPQKAGKAVWTLDYIPDPELQEKDEALGHKNGYVSMAVGDRNLAQLPQGQVPRVSSRDIRRVQDAENFLFLLNPENFATRLDYLTALQKTPYDAVVVDLYYGDKPLTPAETAMLQDKPQGGRRLVLCYLSVGEAADYRPYWQPDWKTKPPDWVGKPNPDWPGSYRVKYWRPEWKHLLYGSDGAYLDQILNAGFDGVFLDVMDAWQTYK